MSSRQISLAQYLLTRLYEVGITEIFGVPGDYNLRLLDYVEESSLINWVPNCNELNAAYSADGYARIKGCSALITTHGVGDLSAINGIAGAYAEYVPVVHIVGMPDSKVQAKKLPHHHTLADGDFTNFMHMHSSVTVAQVALLKAEEATAQIDYALEQCILYQRPVFIGIACDLFDVMVDQPLTSIIKQVNEKFNIVPESSIAQVQQVILNAKQPIIVVDARCRNYNLTLEVKEFIQLTEISVVTTLAGKGLIDESIPQYLGIYLGKFSHRPLVEYIEDSDLIIWCGYFDTDINSGGYTTVRDKSKMIIIEHNEVQIKGYAHKNIDGRKFLADLNTSLKKLEDKPKLSNLSLPSITKYKLNKNSPDKLTQTTFWLAIEQFLLPNSILAVEVGSSIYGAISIKFPVNTTLVSQALWASIGYSVGSTLGVAAATQKNKQQVYLFVGDGSFQLTVQEISTMLRNGYTPIVFLINNSGYTVERAIHGPNQDYNNISNWDYCKLVTSFPGKVATWKVTDLTTFKSVLGELHNYPDKLRFIEVLFDKADMVELMQKVFSHWN